MRHNCPRNELALLIQKIDFRRLLSIHIPVLLLFFQYQISWIYAESDPAIQIGYYCVIFFSTFVFVLKHLKNKFLWGLLLLGLVIGGVVIEKFVHIMLASWFLMYGYCLVIDSNSSFNKILKFLFFLNGIVVICQLLGVDSIFYAYQSYSNNITNYISFVDNETSGYVTAHQARMSGIFPSTICLSVFQFLIFGQLVASRIYGSKIVYFFVGLIFAVTGSTVCLMLFFFSFIFVLKRKRLLYFQLGFVFGFIILFYFFYSVFAFNYTVETKLSRIDSRLFSGKNSLFTSNFLGFTIIVCSMLCLGARKFLRRFWNGEYVSKSILLMLMVVSPLLIHPLQNDVRYWLIVGVSLAHHRASYLQKNSRSIKYSARSQLRSFPS